MAQSAKELKETIVGERQRIKSTSNQMALTKDQLSKMDPEEVFDWEVEKLEEALKELGIEIGKNNARVTLQRTIITQQESSAEDALPSALAALDRKYWTAQRPT